MNKTESKLLKMLSKLNISSQESISTGQNLTTFEKYLHVDREIQKDLLKRMNEIVNNQQKHLILLTGSSGDGKSHLFSIIDNKAPELSSQFEKYYDATASSEPDKSAIETLLKELESFSDANLKLDNGKELVIQAINLGILNNFVSNDLAKEKYKHLIKFIKESEIYEKGKITRVITSKENLPFSIVNFAGYNDLNFKDGKIESQFYNNLFEKITNTNKTNPFYQAYLSDKNDPNTIQKRILCANYEMLSNSEIKKSIIELLIMARVQNKIIVTTRLLLDFIYQILVPSNVYDPKLADNTPNVYLPYLLFEAETKERLYKPFKALDILGFRSSKIDSLINNYYLNGINEYFEEFTKLPFGNIFSENILKNTKTQKANNCAFIIRLSWLLNLLKVNSFFKDYNYYCKLLEGYYSGSNKIIEEIDELLQQSFYKWFGEAESSLVYFGKTIANTKLGYELILVLEDEAICSNSDKTNQGFLFEMPFTYNIDDSDYYEKIELNFSLVTLMKRIVDDNYKPSIIDEDDYLTFVIFAKQLIKKGQSSNTDLFIINSATDSKFVLRKQPKNSTSNKFKFQKK
jgi:DNA phosphorothioation-dependent restriction protein DptF